MTQDLFERLDCQYAALSLVVARSFIMPANTRIAALHVLDTGSIRLRLAQHQDQYFFYNADVLRLDTEQLVQLHAQSGAST